MTKIHLRVKTASWGACWRALALTFGAAIAAGAVHAQAARPKAPGAQPTCQPGETHFFRDEAMTMKVATKLQFNKELLREKVAVKVSGGVATLSGAVTTADLAATAGRLAAHVEGIRCVNNQLTIGVAS